MFQLIYTLLGRIDIPMFLELWLDNYTICTVGTWLTGTESQLALP